MNSWLSLPLAALAILPLAAQTGKSLLEQDASGWIDIMPGPGLKGWTRLPIAPDPLAPESQWKVQNGVLICEGDKGHDWIRFDREFTDFVFHVEFRYTPIAGNPRYNSGIFIRSAADYSSWFQVQIGSSQGGYLFGRGPDGRRFTTADRTPDQTLVKPAGEWNVVETTVQGPVARIGSMARSFASTAICRCCADSSASKAKGSASNSAISRSNRCPAVLYNESTVHAYPPILRAHRPRGRPACRRRACKKSVAPNVAATVNGRPITTDDLNKQYKRSFPNQPEARPSTRFSSRSSNCCAS